MSYVLPSKQDLNDLIQRSLSTYIEGHVLNYYAVDYVEELSLDQIREVLAAYFNEKSLHLESPIVTSLYYILMIWQSENGQNIL
jgi:hypothetical protein